MKSQKLSVEFKDFLIEAKKQGYGSEGVKKVVTESGSYQIVYERDGYRYTDNFIGGNPYIGFEHVSALHPENDGIWLPVWGMSYEGGIVDDAISPSDLAMALRKVLTIPDPDFPIRGPLDLYDLGNGTSYELHIMSDAELESFRATEEIHKGFGSALYHATFLGGLAARNAEIEALNPHWLAP